MKKVNFKNQINEDDKKLIDLLKTSISREPSEQFVENTLKKFLTLKDNRRIVYKPLKSPLYIMLAIVLILLAPIFMTFSFQVFLPEFGFKLGDLVEDIMFQMDSWYLLTLMVLVLVSMSVLWVELGSVKFRNPFV